MPGVSVDLSSVASEPTVEHFAADLDNYPLFQTNCPPLAASRGSKFRDPVQCSAGQKNTFYSHLTD